ncbi:hypothetical protein ACEPPN_000019 [Leptodophora sp. 'Broadleaf-Isolate-01']
MTVSVKSSPISTTPSEAAEPVSLLSTLGPTKFNEVSPKSLQSRLSTGAFFSRPPKPSNGKIETEAKRMLRITNQFLQETRTLPTAVLDMRSDGASQKASYFYIDESPLSLPTTSAYQEQCCPYKWHMPIKAISQEQNPYEAQNKHSYKDLDVVNYGREFGSSSSIGIIVPVPLVLDDVTHLAAAYLPTHLSIEELVNKLESEVIDVQALDRHLSGIASSFWGSGYKDHLESLEALHFAAEIYSHLMDATIDGWAQNIRNTKLERPKALSCIAAFESGNLNIHPSDLKDVMGISTGNSLYIAEYLWMDPYERPSPLVIKRSIGNIRKPGLAFLISPTNSNMKEPYYSSWVNIPHENFDGNCEGTFEKTSLHLSFTRYESSLSASEHGLFDKQVYFLQAVVQVFDAGAWVVDLDLVTALDGDFGTNYLRRLPQAKPKSKINPTTERASMEKAEEEPNSCIAGVQIITSPAVPGLLGSETVEMISFRNHSAEESQDFSVIGQLTSLDCWDEILDTPNNACIVQTNGDWLASGSGWLAGVGTGYCCPEKEGMLGLCSVY